MVFFIALVSAGARSVIGDVVADLVSLAGIACSVLLAIASLVRIQRSNGALTGVWNASILLIIQLAFLGLVFLPNYVRAKAAAFECAALEPSMKSYVVEQGGIGEKLRAAQGENHDLADLLESRGEFLAAWAPELEKLAAEPRTGSLASELAVRAKMLARFYPEMAAGLRLGDPGRFTQAKIQVEPLEREFGSSFVALAQLCGSTPSDDVISEPKLPSVVIPIRDSDATDAPHAKETPTQAPAGAAPSTVEEILRSFGNKLSQAKRKVQKAQEALQYHEVDRPSRLQSKKHLSEAKRAVTDVGLACAALRTVAKELDEALTQSAIPEEERKSAANRLWRRIGSGGRSTPDQDLARCDLDDEISKLRLERIALLRKHLGTWNLQPGSEQVVFKKETATDTFLELSRDLSRAKSQRARLAE